MPKMKPTEPPSQETSSVADPVQGPQATRTPPSPLAHMRKLNEQQYRMMEWWELMNIMTEADWEDKTWYAYRKLPPHERVGEQKNLGKFSMGMSKEMFKESFGGGTYKFIMTQLGRQAPLKDVIREIEGEPKWTANEVPLARAIPSSNGSASELMLMRVMDSFTARIENALEKVKGNTTQEQALTGAISLLQTGSQKALELMAERTKGEQVGPKDMIAMFTEGMKFAKDAVIAQNPAAAVNPVDQFKSALAIMKEVREFSPRESAVADVVAKAVSGEGGDWKMIAAEAVKGFVQFLPDITRGIAEIMRASGEVQAQRLAAILRSRTPGSPVPIGIPAAPIPGPETAQPMQAATAEQVMAGQLALDELKRKVVQMYREGDPGDFVARWIQVAAPEAYELLKAQFPDQQSLLALFQRDPILAQLGNTQDLPEFTQDIVKFFQGEKSGENADGSPSAPPSAASPPAGT